MDADEQRACPRRGCGGAGPHVQTANAAITGTVVGDMRDYAISSRTSNAQNNLPMDCAYEDQTKRLWATTSNGRIDVRFV